MAVIFPDLTVLPLPPLASTPGWATRGRDRWTLAEQAHPSGTVPHVSRRRRSPSSPRWAAQGQVRAGFRDMTAALGVPSFGVDSREGATMWQLDTPAGAAQVHNWFDGAYFLRYPDTFVGWTIQAPTPAVLPWIFKIATGSTEKFPHAGHDLAVSADRVTLTQAYVQYLVRRSDAIYTSYVLNTADREQAVTMWRQLITQAGSVLRALVPGRSTAVPAPVGSLEQELLRVAETPCAPGNDPDVHDEFVFTASALATATIPASPATVRDPR